MPFVTINNIPVEVDKYGYVTGSRLDTKLETSRGTLSCIIRHMVLGRKIVIEADLHQGGEFLLSKITMFRAGVYMMWDGQRYAIIDKWRRGYTNAFWLELESLISNTIQVNE